MKKIIVLIAVVLLLASCTPPELPELPSSKVYDYRGPLLDPDDAPENSIKGIQEIDIDTYSLEVFGFVDIPQTLTYQQVLSLTSYQKTVALYCVEGWSVSFDWEGVLITDIIDLAGIGDEAVTVIFHAADGYTTSLPLYVVQERQMLLAYRANDDVLTPRWGYPFIVVAEDRLGYKWARWVTGIELSDDPEYQGFWESRGYDNDAKRVPEETR